MSSTVAGIAADPKAHKDAIEQLKESLHKKDADEPSSNDGHSHDLSCEERKVREDVHKNILYLALMNGLSSVAIFALYLISIESMVSVALSVGMTIYAYNRIKDGDDSSFNGEVMNWVLLSFVVVTPLSATVTMAFRRREYALQNIALLRATVLELYTAHAIWDFELKPGSKETGRTRSTVNWLEHGDESLRTLLGICLDTCRYLTLPNWTRGRHKITRSGKKEAQMVQELAEKLHKSIIVRSGQLAYLCEVLKQEGLPGNESNRIRQYERFVLEYVEKLRMLKMYRTPQALRSFSRLFSIFMPPFYAPYYAQMAVDLNSLGAALAYAVITSIALTSLFESIHQMEDPFIPMSVLDGVQVENLLVTELAPQLMELRNMYFPEAGEFVAFLTK